MELVKCNKEYWEFVRNLRNDRRVIDGFIESTYITPEMQTNYMNKHSECYRIALVQTNVGGKLTTSPAGFIGVIEDDIRICTHPEFQNKGIGKFMLKEIMKIFPTAYGKVKINNEASLNLFKSVGFEEKFIIFKYNK